MLAIKPAHFLIFLAIALYLSFSLIYLSLPGLQYDELLFVNAALGNVDNTFIAWGVRLFGKRLPLMNMTYIGALKSFLYAPIFRIFGTSAITVRLPVVFIGLITLLTAYALFRRMFSRKVALAALMLFATNPTFIFANKLDWGPVSLMLALEVSSLYFLWRWMSEGRRCFLGLAGFLFGLGLYNKIVFIWYLAAVFIALFLCFREHVLRLLRRRNLVCFVLLFLLGSLPLISFNISHRMRTFRGQRIVTPSLAEALVYHYGLFRTTLDGRGVCAFMNGEDPSDPEGILQIPAAGKVDCVIKGIAGCPWIGATLMPFAVLGSLALVLVCWRLKHLDKKAEIFFLIAQLFLIVAFICASAEAGGAQHAIVAWPFVFILVAFAVCALGSWLGRSGAASGAIACILTAALVIPQVVVDARYLRTFHIKGGVGAWSDAIYELSSFARRYPNKNFLLPDWGFSTQLLLLSGGRIKKKEVLCVGNSMDSCMESLVSKADSLLVFHIPPFETQPVLNAFRRALSKLSLQGRILKTFYQRDGRPIYAVYEVVNPNPEAYK